MKADISVSTNSGHYPISVRGSLPGIELKELTNSFTPGDVFLVIDDNAERHHGRAVRECIGQEIPESRVYVVPAGEGSKSIDQLMRLHDFFLTNGARRNSIVVAAGGGVTGDLAGFAASTTMRGLPLIHLPTTLLAMVDSSVGGKTGINHAAGKNLIGSFYQPEAIYMSTHFLSTLPQKEWINGLSEILKYGAIEDPAIFETCEKLFLHGSVTHDDPALLNLIKRCVEIKAGYVAADEKESGLRMHLNFGHTFAHALENLGGYETISHGEAVFMGMTAALKLSALHGASMDNNILTRFRRLYKPDPGIFSFPVEELVRSMYHDKKRTTDKLKFILLHDWGKPCVEEINETSSVSEAWRYAFDLFNNADNVYEKI